MGSTFNNISTNILRDASKEIDYIVTPNSKEIFERIFLHNYVANKSFSLIGNYGTGKSTFLWAMERNLHGEQLFFGPLPNKEVDGYDFIKIIGQNTSLSDALGMELGLKGSAKPNILEGLEKRRIASLKKRRGLVLVIDEFGKFLEHASKHSAADELYLVQQISEWANDDAFETYFIISLHQSFASYGSKLNNRDKLEWEKVKGRFVDLMFNEPVEQLIYFAGKKLEQFEVKIKLQPRLSQLTSLIQKSKLVSFNPSTIDGLSKVLYPMDWLSVHLLVYSLQRYGQNERSLFSFLTDQSNYSIQNLQPDFYTVPEVFNYLVNTMPSTIESPENPHRPQWRTTFNALERAELNFDENYGLASDVIKTIGLVNIFSKAGGCLDKDFLVNYFLLTKEADVSEILEVLEKSGIIRFYKHSNKINFLDGTDIDLEQELIAVAKEINPDFSVSEEIFALVELPMLMVKKYSFETGTPRFFEYRVFKTFKGTEEAKGSVDGFINLVFENIKEEEILSLSRGNASNIFVIYKNLEAIKKEIFTIKQFDLLIERNQLDANALQLLNLEREFHLKELHNLTVNHLFGTTENTWIYRGGIEQIPNKKRLFEWLTNICYEIYPETPRLINELINKEFLSSPINAARKSLIRMILENEEVMDLGFPEKMFPPQKAIYISLLKQTKIHKANKELGYYELSQPPQDSILYGLWNSCMEFILNARDNKRNLQELYGLLSSPPYKLKQGFIDFWIPIFLIANREEYALFYIDGSYIPYLQEDTFDLIHRKPENFFVKSYDVSGIRVNLLESYKRLTGLSSQESNGTESTFLSIFSNFLRFQRALNGYSRNTSKISDKAIRLRNAINLASDPEDALFTRFPEALGFNSISIGSDVAVLESYTEQLQVALREIQSVYGELLDRIEKVLLTAFFCTYDIFPDYKMEILEKLEYVDPIKLGKFAKVFYQRLISPLDNRENWIKSLADVVIGKGIDELQDEEESILLNTLEDIAHRLIKASEIHQFNENSKNSKLYSFRLYGKSGEVLEDKLVVSNVYSKDFSFKKREMERTLNTMDHNSKKQLLIELLSNELLINEKTNG
ncbi:hypothetical protein [Allomuricauda sp. NBRC 101325]|uniref:hypothetical protein n=1 Tax=Allomuricauda sp. NBRC 101325 TaxID=1113758 RepID=UPI0024A26E34|nr:hypothetical protein [Muricauda sp. NBRC 101325]GLU45408.1 hypothetical protein Musp01_30320 [Muricauda sp. NBRC 101325]